MINKVAAFQILQKTTVQSLAFFADMCGRETHSLPSNHDRDRMSFMNCANVEVVRGSNAFCFSSRRTRSVGTMARNTLYGALRSVSGSLKAVFTRDFYTISFALLVIRVEKNADSFSIRANYQIS